MASNPLVSQGVLNRLRASATFADNPALNVTSPYLGREGISITAEGPATTTLPTQTGVVQSPEPFIPVRIRLDLLRSQVLSSAFKAQIESNCVIGNLTIRPDSTTLPDYTFTNCAIVSGMPNGLAGQDASFPVEITGIYYINNNLWSV